MNFDYCDFIAGCFGGACGILIGHPLDTIKTWQQATNSTIRTSMYEIIVRNNGFYVIAVVLSCNHIGLLPHIMIFASKLNSVTGQYYTQLNGFYRGMTFPFFTTGAINTLFFGIYGNEFRNLQNNCNNYKEKQEKWGRHVLVAGSMAGLVQAFIACPMELITIRLQTRNYYLDYRRNERRGPVACIKTIFKTDGISGFYRGLLPTLCRDVIPYGIYMLVYEKVLKLICGTTIVQQKRQLNGIDDPSSNTYEFIVTALSGSIAGIFSWVLVIPFDVVKTKMQAEYAVNKYTNMFHCIEINIERHGWTFLFRGSWMLLFRSIPVNSATFVGYEYILKKCKMFHNS